MDTQQAIERRRSIKHYDATHVMPPEDEARLFELAMLSPTAFNIQHWRFIVVKDTTLRQEIRKAAWDQSQVTDASLLVILCADEKAWEKDPRRYWTHAPQEVQDFMVPAIEQYYGGRPQVQRDECMRTCGLAGQTLMLAANDMGYDACPMDGFDFEKVAELIQLPDDHLISFMVAIGKGTTPPWPRPGQLPPPSVVITDRFPG